MQRNFLRGLLICLIPCLVAALVVAPVRVEKAPSGLEIKYVGLSQYKLGIDLAGGTILVYEVNLERTKARKAALGDPAAAAAPQRTDPAGAPEGLTSEEMNNLAHQIKRRIDPTDIKNVTVRPSGNSRLEIILPTGGASGGKANLSKEDIEEVKRLISQMGVLEFRILANGVDDQAGIAAAAALANGKSPEEVRQRALEGLPPEPPEGEFNVDIGETKARVRYIWSELGPEQRESLGLSNAQENASGLWATLAGQRDKAVPVGTGPGGGYSAADPVNANMLLYSRKAVGRDLVAKEAQDVRKLVAEGQLPASLLTSPDGAPRSDAELHEAALADPEAMKQLNFKKVEYFVLTRVSPQDSLRVGGDITITASADTDPKTLSPSVSFQFNSAGGQLFADITRRNKPSAGTTRNLAILLDDRVVSAPGLQSEIGSRGQITGKFDSKSVDRLVQILKSGALSAELREKPVSENTIGPTLGQDTIVRGTTAVGAAFLAVLAFMVFYYRFAGVVACVALFANLLLTVGFMVAVNAAFTLPGLAGLVLTLGMAVDANVLIYERLREERNKGANIATALRNGYERAFLTIIDTHLTSIFTAIVLYTFGNDQLKGFAISLTVGLVISLFTSLYMTRLMFDFWLHKKWLTDLRMMRLFERPNFNPMKYRWFFFPLTGALTVLGLGVFLWRGEAGLNVDFRGGTVFAGKLKPGEERGLTRTSDGKDGFRELFSEEAQRNRLVVKGGEDGVIWENKDKGENVWVYTITYADGAKRTVTLTAQPGGPNATEAEMAADVRARAGQLPDVSVEQMFLTGENYDEGKSRYFTIRTTEKQPALVRASLDRLLRTDAGASMMDGATMTVLGANDAATTPDKVTGPKVTLSFDKPTSLAFVRELLEVRFKNERAGGRESFTLKEAEGAAKVDGRVNKMVLDVSGNPLEPRTLQNIVAGAKAAFDGTPEPERLEVFDSQLASETREKAFMAIVASWIAILLYLWFRFGNWTFGLAAVICLIHDLCFTIGAIAACHYLHLYVPAVSAIGIEDFKIDLAAVAALLTLVGYSVNEIIVNFARIREVRGKNPLLTPQMVNDSVNQTLSRTVLTSLTVFLASAVLFVFGGEGVHLFAFVMVVGVLVATYSSIFVASPLLLFLGEGRDTTAVPAEAAEGDKEKEEGAAEEEAVEG